MDEVDRVAGRMSLAALSGLLGGAALATYKGSPLPKTCVSMAMSCAVVGTACFGFERLSNVALRHVVGTNDKGTKTKALYGSHALGGMVGGGIAGALFQRRPVPGMVLCTPIMVAVAFAEEKFEEKRQERLRKVMSQAEENSRIATNAESSQSP